MLCPTTTGVPQRSSLWANRGAVCLTFSFIQTVGSDSCPSKPTPTTYASTKAFRPCGIYHFPEDGRHLQVPGRLLTAPISGGLFEAVFSLRGRVNFTNLARFSPLNEQTLLRHFQKAFRWVWFNLVGFRLRYPPEELVIGVFDCRFLPKDGTRTLGLDQSFSLRAGTYRKGDWRCRSVEPLRPEVAEHSRSTLHKRRRISQQIRPAITRSAPVHNNQTTLYREFFGCSLGDGALLGRS